MNAFNQTLLALLISAGIAGCGGSQNDIPLDYDIPLKTPSTVTDYPLSVRYADNYAIPENIDSLQFRDSQRYGEQWATTFSYARNMSISRISWLGRVENNNSLLDGNARFVMRLFDDEHKGWSSVPVPRPTAEYLVEAEAHLIGTFESGYLYEFTYSDYEIFRLGAGNYWMSIADPEIEGINFSWALTTGTPSSIVHRASVRTADQGEWQSWELDEEFEPMAIRIEGGQVLDNQ